MTKINIVKNKNNFSDMTTNEESLYYKLRMLRLEFAKKLRLPAYVIFPDRTLIAMVKIKPKDTQDLEKIYGIGKAKSKKFGKYFLKLIKEN